MSHRSQQFPVDVEILFDNGVVVVGLPTRFAGHLVEVTGLGDGVGHLLWTGDPEAPGVVLHELCRAGVGLVLDDADTATRERPQQFRGEQLPCGGLDEHVCSPVGRDALLAVTGGKKGDTVTDLQFVGHLLVLPASRAVAEDGRVPATVAQLGQREQELVEVGRLVEWMGVHEVDIGVRFDRFDAAEVDALGDDLGPVAVRAALAGAGPDDLRGDKQSVGPACGRPRKRLAGGIVAVPLGDQRGASETCTPVCGPEVWGRGTSVDDVRAEAGQSKRQTDPERGSATDAHAAVLQSVLLERLDHVTTPPLVTEQCHVVAPLQKQPGDPLEATGTGSVVVVGGPKRHERHAHTLGTMPRGKNPPIRGRTAGAGTRVRRPGSP